MSNVMHDWQEAENSLEEHVALALAEHDCDHRIDLWVGKARAAIAAVREHDASGEEVSMSMFVSSAEKRRYEMGMKQKSERIIESERAACEAIARGYCSRTHDGDMAGMAIGNAIAARKGKGEGK